MQFQLAELNARGRSGADWFFWIAALSLINSVILLSGGDTHFVVGLGVTLIADVIAKTIAEQNPEIAGTAQGIAFAFDLLDGMIYVLMYTYLLVDAWLSIGFHAIVLFCMASGFRAYRQMKAIQVELQQQLAAGVSPH